MFVRGLRRLAGLRVFNRALSSNTGDVFYDALHLWEVSLRKNKAKLTHFLHGVVGCGGAIELIRQTSSDRALGAAAVWRPVCDQLWRKLGRA